MSNSEEKLKKLLQQIAKEQGYQEPKMDIKPTSSGGANYTTNLFLATISEALKSDLKLFAKVANLSEEVRLKIDTVAKVYLVESIFYTEIAVNFERIHGKNNVAAEERLLMPKFYGEVKTKFEEMLVLEDLEAKGFLNFDRMKTFNWEYAATAVTELAKFHALGLAFRDENPTEFERITHPFKVDMADKEKTEGFLKLTIQNGFEAVNEEYRGKLEKYFSSMNELMKLMNWAIDDKTVLIHGDYRTSNLMHRRRNGKLEIIPVDYQTLRMGNPMNDLMLFIFAGSDEEFRRLHYHRLMDHYYTELTLALRRLQMDVEKVYPRESFDNDMIKFLPIGLLLALSIMAVVTVDAQHAPQMEGHGELASLTVKPNQLARERLTGIVRDYVRWGVM